MTCADCSGYLLPHLSSEKPAPTFRTCSETKAASGVAPLAALLPPQPPATASPKPKKLEGHGQPLEHRAGRARRGHLAGPGMVEPLDAAINLGARRDSAWAGCGMARIALGSLTGAGPRRRDGSSASRGAISLASNNDDNALHSAFALRPRLAGASRRPLSPSSVRRKSSPPIGRPMPSALRKRALRSSSSYDANVRANQESVGQPARSWSDRPSLHHRSAR